MERERRKPRYEYNFNSARIKVQAPSEYLIQKIIEAVMERFPGKCITSPIMASRPSGFHTFLTVMEER